MLLASVGLSTQIYNNHLRSALLLAGFPVLLLLMTGAFFGALDASAQSSVHAVDWAQAWRAAERGVIRYGYLAFTVTAVWFTIAYFFNGSLMRMATHARPITRAESPRIYNLLENLCISRGIPMPQFEVIESPALNAFATGIDEKSYRIVLTRGIIEAMPDDELESVIAHELTHVINRDARLMVVAVIFAGMISFFAQVLFRSMVYGRRSSRESRNGGAVLLIALAILAVGWFFAIVIRFALSRRREYLADEGSIMLTKNPEAMMKALQRIAGHDSVAGMPQGVQQMCIENNGDVMDLFATHPPIADRIKTISQLTSTPIPALPETRSPSAGPWGATS